MKASGVEFALHGKKPKSLRNHNYRAVIEAFRLANRPLSISYLSASLNLSRTAMTSIINELVEAKAVTSIGKGDSTDEGGKKPSLYAIEPTYRYCVTLTIDATYCVAEIRDFTYQTVVARSELFTTPLTYPEAVSTVAEIICDLIKRSAIDDEKIVGIVVCSGGIINVTTGVLAEPIVRVNRHWGHNLPFKNDISKLLPYDIPVYYDNNCRYLGFYEVYQNSIRLQESVAVIYSNDNVGGCLIDHGHLVYGSTGMIGEFGHFKTDYTCKRICSCGKTGCFETTVSRSAMKEMALSLVSKYPKSPVVNKLIEDHFLAENLFPLSDAGDPLSIEIMNRTAENFARLIYHLQLACNPDEIIIKGVFADSSAYFRNRLETIVRNESLDSVGYNLKIVYSEGEILHQSHIGAAMYCFNESVKDSISG